MPAEKTSSTSISPAPATSAPTTVRRVGRCPWRAHSQPITATGAVYSISSATATGSRSTALKYASWQPATAITP